MIIINCCELTLAITALANVIASKLTNDEMNILGTVFTQLGDTLSTIAACPNNNSNGTNKDAK